jgi:hypothetical protein
MIAALDIDWGMLIEAAVVSAVFGIGIIVVAGVAVVASLQAQDRQAVHRGAIALQVLTGACVIAIAAAIVLAIYVMANK